MVIRSAPRTLWRAFGVAAAAVVLAAGLTIPTANAAQAAPACWTKTVDLLDTFRDHATSCHDLNVTWSNTKRNDLNGARYWGQYYHGYWDTGDPGRIWLRNGSHGFVVFINNIAPTTWERMRGNHGAFVTVAN